MEYELDYDALRENASESVQNMSDNKLEEIYSVFAIFDKDGSGSISVDEFADIWRALGQNPTEDELQTLLLEVDADGSGEIDFEEFVELVARFGSTYDTEEDELKAAFQLFDPENNGYINSEQLRQILTALGEDLSEEELDEMIAEADENGDGKVDYEEFVRVMVKGNQDEDEPAQSGSSSGGGSTASHQTKEKQDKNSNQISTKQTKKINS